MIETEGRQARFTLTRAFACGPRELFAWLTEPARIARWSLAPVTMREPFVAGAARRVTIQVGRLRVQRLDERITWAEPGRGFAYVGTSVTGHRGEVTLRRQRLGSELRWEACFEAPHSVLAWPIARFVSQQMSQSFARLGQEIGSSAQVFPSVI
ncbi:MAG TPA: SRPBCC family protein [Polyangiales bacterium]|nr:SRPBCC family protein [Polyangiales bacterium]